MQKRPVREHFQMVFNTIVHNSFKTDLLCQAKLFQAGPLIHNRALAARKAVKESTILAKDRKENTWIYFLMAIMASGIARGHEHMATTTTAMAAILQLIGWERPAALVYSILLWY